MQEFVQEFKKSGQFDAIRKKVLEDFSSSQTGQNLYKSLCETAKTLTSRTQIEMVAELGKQKVFQQAERSLNSKEFLANQDFKESLKKKLRMTMDGRLGKEADSKPSKPDVNNPIVLDTTKITIESKKITTISKDTIPADSYELPKGFKRSNFVEIQDLPVDIISKVSASNDGESTYEKPNPSDTMIDSAEISEKTEFAIKPSKEVGSAPKVIEAEITRKRIIENGFNTINDPVLEKNRRIKISDDLLPMLDEMETATVDFLPPALNEIETENIEPRTPAPNEIERDTIDTPPALEKIETDFLPPAVKEMETDIIVTPLPAVNDIEGDKIDNLDEIETENNNNLPPVNEMEGGKIDTPPTLDEMNTDNIDPPPPAENNCEAEIPPLAVNEVETETKEVLSPKSVPIATKVVKNKRGRPRKSLTLPDEPVPTKIEVVNEKFEKKCPKRKGSWKGYVELENETEIKEETVVELGLVGRTKRKKSGEKPEIQPEMKQRGRRTKDRF